MFLNPQIAPPVDALEGHELVLPRLYNTQSLISIISIISIMALMIEGDIEGTGASIKSSIDIIVPTLLLNYRFTGLRPT